MKFSSSPEFVFLAEFFIFIVFTSFLYLLEAVNNHSLSRCVMFDKINKKCTDLQVKLRPGGNAGACKNHSTYIQTRKEGKGRQRKARKASDEIG